MNFKFKTTALAVISMGVLAGVVFASAQTTAPCYQFNTNLRYGNTGADVKALQQALNTLGFAVAPAGQAGSAGHETSYFGNATKGALIRWQEANAGAVLTPWGLNSGTGFFGATSRAEMNKCSGTPTTPDTTPGVSGSLSVSLAQVQPNNVLVAGQAHAKLADFVFSGTGIVTGVQLQRTGISNNTTLTNVYLYDGSTKITDAASVMADGSIRFNFGTGLFSVAGSKTISVYADIEKGNTSGQSVGVALTGYTTSGNAAAVVSGVNGPNLPIGSATLAGVKAEMTTSQNQANIGDQNVNIWSAGVTVSEHDVYFVGGSFRLIGSAPYSALSNVKLYIDGVQVGNAAAVDGSGRISFYGGNHLVRSGYHTVNVRGDVADGAGRYLQVSLEQGSDLLFEDAQLRGAYVMPTNTANGAIYNYNGTQLDIGACQSGSGSCTVLSADSQFTGTAARVTVGASNQVIGKFKLTAIGEPVQLKTAELKINTNKANPTDKLTNVSVYVNGMAVSSGAVAELGTASSTIYLSNLGGVIVNPGQTASIEIKADLRNTNGTNISAPQNLTAELRNLQVQGVQSRNISTSATVPSLSAVVGDSTAIFAKTSSFSDTTATPNAQDVKIGSFTMSTGYAEGVNLTQIDVTLEGDQTLFDRSQISSLTLKSSNGQSWQRTAGSGITGSTTLSFSLWDSIPANTSNVYEVFANFNNATGSLSVTGKGYFTGQVSNVVASGTATAVVTTFSEAKLGSVSLDSNSDSERFVNGNITTNTVFLISSTNNVKLNTLELAVSDPAIVAGVKVNGQDAQAQGNGHYQITLTSPITLSSGFGSQVPVQLSFVQPTNVNKLSDASSTVSLTYLGTDQANVYEGVLGAYTPAITGATSNKFIAAITLPTEVKAVSGSTVNNGTGIKLGTITVKTDGAIKINAIPFNIALANSGTSTNIVLKRGTTNITGSYTGSVYNITSGDIVSGTVAYDVYADVASMSSSGSATVTLGAPASFSWHDSEKAFDGTGIATYGN